MDLINKRRSPKYYKDIEDRRNRLRMIKVLDLDDEKWVDLSGYEGYYKVSNLARIKSVCRIVPKKNGSTVIKPEQLIRPCKNSDGYLSVSITKDMVSKTYSLHTLLAKEFVLNPLNLQEVNHIDGNKLNCLPCNLEWVTRKYNIQHSVINKLRSYTKGVNCGKYKVSNNDVINIFYSKERTSVLAKKYNITKSSIQRIKSGKTYKNITSGLDPK